MKTKEHIMEEALDMVEEEFDKIDLAKAQSSIDSVLKDEVRCREIVSTLLSMDYSHTASGGTGTHFMDCANELAYQFYSQKPKE